jgi:hypothetical protein
MLKPRVRRSPFVDCSQLLTQYISWQYMVAVVCIQTPEGAPSCGHRGPLSFLNFAVLRHQNYPKFVHLDWSEGLQHEDKYSTVAFYANLKSCYVKNINKVPLYAQRLKHSKPSLIRLQLIRIEIWKKWKILFTVEYILWKDKWDLQARDKRIFRTCWGQLERLKSPKKISKIGLSWMKETLDFSCLLRTKLL